MNPSIGFVIAGKGVRYQHEGGYSAGIWVIGAAIPVRTLTYELLDGPEGMKLSQNGELLWIPRPVPENTLAVYSFKVRVHEEGRLIFEKDFSNSLDVLASPLVLNQPEPWVDYEREALGWTGITFTGYQPSSEDRRSFRWSIVNSPPGVSINDSGDIRWPTDFGYARDEPYEFLVRMSYETASGWLSDEVTYSHRVLPASATCNYNELRAWNVAPTAGGMLGFWMASGGDWLAAGEPFLNKTFPGRVRLWRRNPQDDQWMDMSILQPSSSFGGDAFGAAISLSEATSESPLRLVVGAPGTSIMDANGQKTTREGALHLYTWKNGSGWALENTISPPVAGHQGMFGDAVAIDGLVCVGGIPEADFAGQNTGALAVYRRGSSGWAWSETVLAREPAVSDMFGESVALGGAWLAVGASGDDGRDETAPDSGAVYIYRDNGTSHPWVQTLRAPVPQAGMRVEGIRVTLNKRYARPCHKRVEVIPFKT